MEERVFLLRYLPLRQPKLDSRGTTATDRLFPNVIVVQLEPDSLAITPAGSGNGFFGNLPSIRTKAFADSSRQQPPHTGQKLTRAKEADQH